MKNRIRWLVKKTIRFISRHILKRKQLAHIPKRFRRVAFFIAGGLGDAIMAFPAIRFISQKFPEAAVTVFVPREKYFLLSAVFKDLCVRQLQFSPAFILLYGLPIRRFDIAFTNTVAVFKIAIELAALFSSRVRCGFRYPDEQSRDRVYTFSKVFSDTAHAAEQNVQLISELVSIPYSESNLFLPAGDKEKIEVSSASVIIHPGSEEGYENKRWPLTNYNEIISKFIEKGCTVTVLLGPAESDMENEFVTGEKIRLLVNPDIPELIDLYRNAGLFVGNDSGPAHLAAYYGIPEVVLFGPVQPERSGPHGIDCTAIYNEIDCSPCHFTSVACQDNRCMQSITVEQVWNEVERKLL